MDNSPELGSKNERCAFQAENIYSQYLDLVEMAILYNLENETNFSLSFGELHYPKNVRVFDKTICTINQEIINIKD